MGKITNWFEDLLYPGRRQLREENLALIQSALDEILNQLNSGKTLDEVIPYESETPPEWDRVEQEWVIRMTDERKLPIGKPVFFRRGRGDAENEIGRVTAEIKKDNTYAYAVQFE